MQKSLILGSGLLMGLFLGLSGVFSSTSFAADSDMTTVSFVDPVRYAGRWYQIARYDLFFEAGCVCSQQTLAIRTDGNLDVYNSCNDKDSKGKIREVRGVAYNEDTTTNAKFSVDFGFAWRGNYWVIGLGANYEYAVVSEPSKRSLYILSKTPELSPDLYDEALGKAAQQLDINKLIKTSQQGCTYP